MPTWYRRKIVSRGLDKEMGRDVFTEVRQEVLVDASGIVLEIGAGPGHNIPIYKNISKLYALEPISELIDIAKKRTEGVAFPVEFLNSGAEKIPLADQSVDTVVSTWTLCSVDDLPQVLREIKRVLKPGGKFVFVDHGASPKPLVRALQTGVGSVTKYFTGNCHFDRPIEKLIKEAGFEIQKMTYQEEDTFRTLIYNYQGIATPK